jgi:EpsI family protein
MRFSADNLRFGFLLALLLTAGLFINIWERAGEAHVERQSLANFPVQMGNWRQIGADQRFDAESEKVLRADDYLSRNFAMADGKVGSFYVGYYATQRNGATYHSPLNCLPGSGWVLNAPAVIAITPAKGGASFEANRYIIQNGDSRQVLIYWYQGRGRAVASEYWGKIYTVLDSVRQRRSDGAMVRVLVPIGKSEPEAIEAAVGLASQAAPLLPAFVPN